MITILGPTASGKTAVAVGLAHRLGSEVISADSRQLYRGMDIGTGKDLAEYTIEGKPIPHHLIDILPAGHRFNVFAYQQAFHRVYEEMLLRGIRQPIFCGGTGLYLEAILRGYRMPDVPANEALRSELASLSVGGLKDRLSSYGPLHNKTDLDSPQRTIRAIEIADYIKGLESEGLTTADYLAVPSVIIGLLLDREERRRRISMRLDQRIEEGMIEEVAGLMARGVKADDLIYYGLEYKYVTLHVLGKMGYDEMRTKLETEIHRFAKRQMTWFRGMERRGLHIHWIDAQTSLPEKMDTILNIASQSID